MERKLLSILIAGLFTAGLTGVAHAADPLPAQPKSEQPGTGNEPAGITTEESSPFGGGSKTASGVAQADMSQPLPLMPKTEYPGTGNEPAGITGIAADAPDTLRSKSEYETGKTDSAPMSRTEDTERDFGEESS